jgi:hypothetical protein
MNRRGLNELTVRLLTEHLAAALLKRDAVAGTILRFADEHNRYGEALGSLSDDQECVIIEGLQLLLANAEEAVGEAKAALALHQKGEPWHEQTLG